MLKKQVLLCTIVLAMVVFASCSIFKHAKPRDVFQKQLFNKMDSLLIALKDFAPGDSDVEVEQTAMGFGKVAKSKVHLSHIALIISLASAIYDKFEYVNLDQVNDLSLAAKDKEWRGRFVSEFKKRQGLIKSEMVNVKSKYLQSPDAYKLDDSSPEDYFRGAVIIDSNEVVFMQGYTKGILITPLVENDIDVWLDALSKSTTDKPEATKPKDSLKTNL
jgi:hypothetical protein